MFNKKQLYVLEGNVRTPGIILTTQNNYDYTILINNDTIVEKNLIEVLLKTAKAKNFSVVQPLILKYNGKEIWNAGGRINYFFGNFNRGSIFFI